MTEPNQNKTSKALSRLNKVAGEFVAYSAAGVAGFFLGGVPGIILGPVIKSKKKYWILWILILFPLQIPFVLLANLLGIYPKIVMSPYTISKFYGCIPEFLSESKTLTPEEKISKLRTWVAAKESSCSENKNFLVGKATVLVSEGNSEDGFKIIENLYSKYPNDPVLIEIRERWRIK